jgi:hypothetical protein
MDNPQDQQTLRELPSEERIGRQEAAVAVWIENEVCGTGEVLVGVSKYCVIELWCQGGVQTLQTLQDQDKDNRTIVSNKTTVIKIAGI